jgi:ArsR family transcriptional regulator
MRDLVEIFKALSDPNRIRIIKMLEVRELCVCEITEVLQLAPSTVSKHLSILRSADLIIDHKKGRWVNYSLNRSTTNLYCKKLLPLLKQWVPYDATILRDKEKVKSVDRVTICAT